MNRRLKRNLHVRLNDWGKDNLGLLAEYMLDYRYVNRDGFPNTVYVNERPDPTRPNYMIRDAIFADEDLVKFIEYYKIDLTAYPEYIPIPEEVLDNV